MCVNNITVCTHHDCECVSGGNGVVRGQSLSIALIDGSGLKLIKPTALHYTHACARMHSYSERVAVSTIQWLSRIDDGD